LGCEIRPAGSRQQSADSVNNIKLLTIKAFIDNLVTHKRMEANDTVKEYIDKLEDLSKESAALWTQLSTKQMESSMELVEIRKMLKNLYASMYVISEGSDSFRITVRKSEELLSFGLSLINEVINRIRFFNESTVNLSQKLEELISKREEINAIVSSLQELNETSGNTARNAEIKAYQAGTSGKGFGVVAEELGRLTGKSLEIVSAMVGRLESLKDRSKEATDKFGTIRESLSSFIGNADDLKQSSDEVRDKISLVMDTSDKLLNLLEDIDIKRRDIEETANFLLSLSRDTLMKLGEIDLLLSQRETIIGILKNHMDIFRYLAGKRSTLLTKNISQIDFALKKVGSLDRYSQLSVIALSSTPIRSDFDLSELDGMKKMLGMIGREIEGVKEIIKGTQYQANLCLDNIKKFQSFIEKEAKGMEEVINIQVNLSRISSGLGRLVENAGDFAEQLRVISLYGKIEASRVPGNIKGLPAIVDEMQKLSNDYSKLGDKLWRFFNPVNEKIEDLRRTTLTIDNTVSRLKDIVKESEVAFQENKDQIETLTEVSSSIRPFIDKQEDVVGEIGNSFNSVTAALKDYTKASEDIEKNLDKEKSLTENLTQDHHWKDLSSIEVIDNDEGSILKVHLPKVPVSLHPCQFEDPAAKEIIYLIHRGLFDLGFSGRIYPLMVERWELSEDVRRWDFIVREDIKDHKGRKIESEDVKFALEKLKESDKMKNLVSIDEIEIKGKYSLSAKLSGINMSFLSDLAKVSSSIMSKDSAGDGVVGIGPFKLQSWEKEENIILESYPDYFVGKPYLSKVIFKTVGNPIEKFKKGLVDVARISSEDLSSIGADKDLSKNLFSSFGLNVNYVGFNFNMKDLPFINKKVRQALNYAIDKETMIGETSSGFGEVSKGVFPSGFDTYNPKIEGYEYNEDKAKKLLSEAGFDGGLPETYTLSVYDSEIMVKRAEFIKEAFSHVGVALKIEKTPWEKFNKKVREGKAQLFLTTWFPESVEPNNLLFALFHSSQIGIENLTFYSSKELDSKIKEGFREINPIRRKRIYRETEKVIVEDAPFVFLLNDVNSLLISERVFGLKSILLNLLHYEWVGVE
jgi:ABC-type transport system substrate-binding protein/methyl-accepting chemotaxis protein